MSGAPSAKGQFTPGPWSASVALEDQSVHKRLRPHYYADVRVGDDRPGNVIARVFMGGDGAITNSTDAVEANARLVAAAPDLLAACEAVNAYWLNISPKGPAIGSDGMWTKLQAALEKARG